MDMNNEARALINRWRSNAKNAERRIIRFDERINLRLDAILERSILQREAIPEWEIKQVFYRDIGVYEPIDADWRPIRVGEMWGGKDVSAFFRRVVTIPEDMAGKLVQLRIYVGGDSLLRLDGVPYHGLDPFRGTVRLSEQAEGGRSYAVELESYIHWYTSSEYYNVFSMAELVAVDPEIEAAYWDFVAAFKMLFVHDIHPSLKDFLEKHLWDALLAIPVHTTDFTEFRTQLLRIRDQFRREVFESDRFHLKGLLHLVGHSHLDIVYVWPHREYIRKNGRTHATMLRLMEQYPDFKFAQSSAKIYADLKEHFPELYAQVRQRIAEGRWQPVGAFWLEPDCNLISGESFVRHILYGQRFWLEEFGFQSRVCWLPDVFGITWALPQILKRSGIQVIMSNKFFVWNDTNPWRQNTFWWEGPDGSRVLAVVPPGHFIGMIDPDHMEKYWRAFSHKEAIGEMIYTYGWGDGGGGADPEMLECALRYADFPGLVPTRFSQAEEALLSILARASHASLPVWRDEMYLEAHRGTYTSKGLLKKLNRQAELLYRQAEILASLAWAAGQDYPADALECGWKMLLQNQFHDALPGTHITEVYHDLLRDYETLKRLAQGVIHTASDALFGADAGTNLLLWNSEMAQRGGVVTLPASTLAGQSIIGHSGVPLVQQSITSLDGQEALLVRLDAPLPSVGYRVLPCEAGPPAFANQGVFVGEWYLENNYLRAEFTQAGELISLWDKEVDRQVIVPGQHGNQFKLYEDRPGRFDAWDIIASYVEQELPIEGEATLSIDETGPLRASLRLVKRCYASTIRQRISLIAGSRELCFETEVDWHERQRLLKVGFPVAVNAHHATYDIAYGHIERPTHRNTSHDAARFEVPGHWWMDISEHEYGVALLNDCKYGHETNGQWMRLTLLKGSIAPDPFADLELHHFTYTLYPHRGGWREGGVQQAAVCLNSPLLVRLTDLPAGECSFISCDAPNIRLEALKRAENENCLILRLTERYNQLTRATLRFASNILSVHICDLLEQRESELMPDGHAVSVELKPREIVTLAICFTETD